jgi:hypothetical protein
MKKVVSIIIFSLALFSCSKVKKGEFLITGTAKGIENGKSVVLQTQDESGLMVIAMDTVKVKDGRFEFRGKIKEPKFYTIIFPELNNGFSLIVENDETKVEVYKDSIQSSKVFGTYNNEELHKFNIDMKKIDKTGEDKIADFRAKNMPAYQAANATKDTATVNRLMKELGKLQEAKQKAISEAMPKYAKEHPKSFISALIIESMFRMPNADTKNIKELYDNLDDDLKNLKSGKNIKKQLDVIYGIKKK